MTYTSKNTSSDFYNLWAEHSPEAIIRVKRWADEEQKRRIADKTGEQQRRYIANQVSEIITTNLRPSWFHKGSSYFFSLLKVARNAGTDLLRSSQVQAMNAKTQITHGVETVGNKATETVQDVKLKVGAVGQRATETAQDVKHKVEAVGQRATETAQDVKHKVEFAGQKAQETSQDVKVRIQEKIGVAQGVAHQGFEKVQEVAHKLKNASLNLFGKVNQVFSYFSENTNLAFAVLEEENERAWRLNSEIEVFAILNALCISSLFKDMAPEFYRPAFEPTRKYSTKLIEEYERSRRVLAHLADRTALNNAKAVSLLIEAKFRVLPCALPPKTEVVETITFNAPMTAAM